jgi:hypothetical protein
MTQDRDPTDTLDALLAQARMVPPPGLPPDFAARLIAAAEAARPTPVTQRPGWRARITAVLAEIGGIPALTGLATAGVAGLWIGLADPAGAAGLVWDLTTGAPLDAGTPFDVLAPPL